MDTFFSYLILVFGTSRLGKWTCFFHISNLSLNLVIVICSEIQQVVFEDISKVNKTTTPCHLVTVWNIISNLVFHLGHFNNIQTRIYHISFSFITSTIGLGYGLCCFMHCCFVTIRMRCKSKESIFITSFCLIVSNEVSNFLIISSLQ